MGRHRQGDGGLATAPTRRPGHRLLTGALSGDDERLRLLEAWAELPESVKDATPLVNQQVFSPSLS
jgi:hypothetical protein